VKSKKLQDALEWIDPKLVTGAAQPPFWRTRRGRATLSAVAALLVIAIGLSALMGSGILRLDHNQTEAPPPIAIPPTATYREDFTLWKSQLMSAMTAHEVGDPMSFFLATTIPEFLLSEDSENLIYSPVSLYLALAMLAEAANGNTREEILTILGCPDMESLRNQVEAIWSRNQLNTECEKKSLGGSLWLNRTLTYHEQAQQLLTSRHHAQVHVGEMGSEEMNQAFRSWINEQTGGLLSNYVDQLSLPSDTALALVSTLFLKSGWTSKFSEGRTAQEVFHAPDGDITTAFMNKTDVDTYYWGNGFTASQKSLMAGGSMFLILPDEGIDPKSLLVDGELLSFLLTAGISGKWENRETVQLHLSLPKFDVSSQLNMIDGLQHLGMTSCFSPTDADLSSLLNGTPAFVVKVLHAARVAVDEEGVVASAYTVILAPEGAAPPKKEITMVFDRPFLFMITDTEGLPLFVGTVYRP